MHRNYYTFWLITMVISGFIISSAQASNSAEDKYWNEHLRYSFFEEQPIIESEDIIQLHTPDRAEDPSVVPVAIYAMIAQTDERYIKKITLLIDNNPVPIAGTFQFTEHSGRADLRMRIRVAEFTPVRAIAELNDGSLHMSRSYVKASGGCSGPIPVDFEKALSRLGKMKLNVGSAGPDNKPLAARLRISHPNFTGMQVTAKGDDFVAPQYVNTVKVRYNDELIFSAETNVSISADPSFDFYIKPLEGGEMVAEITDSNGQSYTKTATVAAR